MSKKKIGDYQSTLRNITEERRSQLIAALNATSFILSVSSKSSNLFICIATRLEKHFNATLGEITVCEGQFSCFSLAVDICVNGIHVFTYIQMSFSLVYALENTIICSCLEATGFRHH
jgi:hypothetical protein